MTRTTITSTTDRSSCRARAKAAEPAQVHLPGRAEATEAEMALTAELKRQLGMEPAPCTPEAHP